MAYDSFWTFRQVLLLFRFILGTRKLLENPDEMAEDGGVSNLQWTGIIQMGVAVL